MPKSSRAKKVYSEPAFCAVVLGKCPYPVEQLDAGITLAYPFRSWTKDWADRMVQQRKSTGASTYAPHKHYSSNYLICDVCREIRSRPVHLSEVTEPNWNVFYEAGFAFGSDKVMVLADDANVDLRRSRLVFPEYLRASYHNDSELLKKLGEAVAKPALRISSITATADPRRLYFVDPGIESEQVKDLKRLLRRSRVLEYSAPAGGLARLPTLQSEIYEIVSARAIVGLLLPENYINQDILNARTCFLIGVAVAQRKPTLLLVQEPAPHGPADLHMLTKPFGSIATMHAIVGGWLTSIGAPLAVTAAKRRKDILQIDLGNAWAERDPYLAEYFLETPQFRRAREARVTVFLGRRGTGKSAIALTLARDAETNRALALQLTRPETFEMQELQDAYLKVTSRGDTAHWKLVLGALWKYLLLSQLAWMYIRHFANSNPEPIELAELRKLINLIPHEEDFVDAVLAVTDWATGSSPEAIKAFMGELSRQKVYAPFVALADRVPGRLILDNLDVTWDTSHEQSRFVLASLIREAERLNQHFNDQLAVLLFLRLDIYNIVKLADPDIDKQTREYLGWNRERLIELVGLRLRFLLNLSGTPLDAWTDVFPTTIEGLAAPDYLLSRTLMRPRELIKLCDLAIERAQGRRASKVSESDVIEAVEEYSEMLLTDLHGEYLIELPDLYYFVLELTSSEWPKAMDDMRAVVRRASEREGAAGRAHAWHSTAEPETVIRRLYEVGVLGLAARRAGELKTVFTPQRDWTSAYAATRTRVRVTPGRRKRREEWSEPLVVLHPALHPVLGAAEARARGDYVRAEWIGGDTKAARPSEKS